MSANEITHKNFFFLILITVLVIFCIIQWTTNFNTSFMNNNYNGVYNQTTKPSQTLSTAGNIQNNTNRDIINSSLDETENKTMDGFSLEPDDNQGSNTIQTGKGKEFDVNFHKNTSKNQRLNVLFLMADDMRTQLGAYYGSDSQFPKPKMITPNFDKLAAKSLLLKNFFVQFALCGPSRTSMLTSRRPDTTNIYDNSHYWRTEGGNFTSLPQHFKQSGYNVLGLGKIYHRSLSSNYNDPISWSQRFKESNQDGKDYLYTLASEKTGFLAVPKEVEEKIRLMDKVTVSNTKDMLRKLAPKALSGEEPFFLAVGMKKPHLSYICPQEYYDMYPIETEEQFLAQKSWQTPFVKPGCNLEQLIFPDVNSHMGILPEEPLRHMRQAYFACVSYVDALLGEILNTVNNLGLTDSTVIAFVADHGYHLGENGIFGKQTTLDASTRVPMMIHIPGQTDHGIVSNSVTEGVDLFTSVVEAAGLDKISKCPEDSSNIKLCTQGKSFLHLIQDPNNPHKDFAVSQVRGGTNYMKYSIRTLRYRFTQWVERIREGTTSVYTIHDDSPDFPIELYDYKYDTEELINRSKDPYYSGIKAKMTLKLKNFLDKNS